MAKKKAEVKVSIKPNCKYCKHSKDIGNHMSLCPFHLYPRANGVNGRVQCEMERFEVDMIKYNKCETNKQK